MQRLSRTFGREKSNRSSLITPFPFEIVPQAKEEPTTTPNEPSAHQASEFESNAAVGILSALDSLSAYDIPIKEGDECTCNCRSNGYWDDILSLRKRKRSLRRNSSVGEDTATLPGTIFTSDSDTLFELTSPPTDDTNKPQPFAKGDVSPHNILRQLFQQCNPGQDNTTLLSKALEYATPDELEKEITRIFHSQLLMAQTIIAAQIPWASAMAGLSSQGVHASQFHELSVQDRLVKALERSNENLLEALEMYPELERHPVKELLRLPITDTNAPRPPTTPPSDTFPQSEETQTWQANRTSVCFSDDSQHTDIPHYIRPLPILPSTTVDHLTHSSPVFLEVEAEVEAPPRAHDHMRSKSLYGRRPPLPNGPRQLALAHMQPPCRRNSDARHSYPPYNAAQKQSVSSLLKESYHAFSVSSPSLKLHKAKLNSRVVKSHIDAGSSYHTHAGSLSVESTEYNRFSVSSPSLVISSELQASASPDVPWHAPTGLAPPAPLRIIPHLHLPDLTGKIVREGDYPAGRGGYADVWKCVMRVSGDDECKVAVKVLQSHIYDQELESKIEKRIRREISIWQRLKHENVLPLLGTVQHFGRYMSLVSPWIENGSLVQYLKECGDDMGMLRRLQLACEVASGLSYLHDSGVVHGDLSGMNVLITEEGKACLCDFGLSSLMLEFHDPTFCTSTIGANARWAAPEIYRISNEDHDTVPIATTKSDVYSFGCILLLILSGLPPYHYLVRDGQILLEFQNGKKPRRPQEGYITDALWDQINACWAEPAVQRPTARHLVGFLQDTFNVERRLQGHLK